MLGTILLGLALALSLLAMLLMGQAGRGRGGAVWGRRLADGAFGSVLLASALLYWYIFQNHFDIAYVWSYSSRDLSWLYKITVFWAGQEGSFLFWLLVHAAAGCVLCRKGRMKGAALAVYLLLQSLLVVLLLDKSPFAPMTESYGDGMGLNPLLQDPWMAIHPPIIFIGYALLAVPYAYAAGSLLMRGGTDWIRPARRWGFLAWGFLGAGIFIGGYWAYKVLGWGGYWGWDPVENSSLVPWLVTAASLHLLGLVRRRPAALGLAHIALLFGYALVIYGTFLTRSGILGDFSVHSFSGSSIGLLLAGVDALVLLGGLALLTWRADTLPKGSLYESLSDPAFFLLAGLLAFGFMAALVFLGMSMPLLTQLAGSPAAMDTGFYPRTLLPLAIAGMLLLAAAQQDTGRQGMPRLLAAGLFLLGLAAAWLTGIRSLLPLLLAGAGLLAAGGALRAGQLHAVRWAGSMAHLGVALGLFAVVLSGSGSQTQALELVPQEAQSVFGRQIVYQGTETAADQRQKAYVFLVDGRRIEAATKLRENGEDAAREPAIDHSFFGDLYIAPTPAAHDRYRELVLRHGRVLLDTVLGFQYDDISIDTSAAAEGRMEMAAVLSVTDGTQVEHPEVRMVMDAAGTHSPVTEILGGAYRLRLTGIAEDQRRIRIELMPSAEEEAMQPVTASVSTKPFIWGLWISAVLVVAGCLAAVRLR